MEYAFSNKILTGMPTKSAIWPNDLSTTSNSIIAFLPVTRNMPASYDLSMLCRLFNLAHIERSAQPKVRTITWTYI